jgi:hypothetical protein
VTELKKAVIAIVVLLSLSLAGFLGWLGSGPGPTAPQFRPSLVGPRIGPYQRIQYEFLSPSPFEGGKMWITVFGGTNNYHCLLYDLERRTILGELSNAAPVFMNGDHSQLLCSQVNRGTPSLRAWITALLQALNRPGLRFRPPPHDTEIFWVLDLNRNVATRLGMTAWLLSTFQPSPTFRYGFIKGTDVDQYPGFFLCDLEKKSLRQVNVAGWPQGWWDESNIVIKDPTNNYVLFHVAKGTTAPLWNSSKIGEFFKKMNLPDDPNSATLFSIWNGKENDFYLADHLKNWQAVESYLIKVERPGPTLNLMSQHFRFGWSDHVDATGRWYLYSGRDAGQASSAVFLRDLRNHTDRTLVTSDGGRYFSIPQFYRDGVIYVRSNMLWRISLNGSNQTRFFPPGETEPDVGGGLRR